MSAQAKYQNLQSCLGNNLQTGNNQRLKQSQVQLRGAPYSTGQPCRSAGIYKYE